MVSVESILKKANAKEGDFVSVETAKGAVKGTVLYSRKGYLDLKQKSGYNVGIALSKVKSVKKEGTKKKPGKAVAQKIAQDKSLPLVSIVHTGGTIASRINYDTGGVIASFDIEDMLSIYPELTRAARIDGCFVENIMSEDINFSHYKKIAKAIKKEIEKGVEGVIVTHGTDTLHYTASALSFMFEELPIPVLLTGSQRSGDRPSSDAGMNLLCAVNFIAKTDFSGVAVCMHSSSSDEKCSIIPGTRARKMHTSRRDAFKAVNSECIAEISTGGEIEFFSKSYPKKKKSGVCVLKDKFEEKVGILRARPNMLPEEILFYKKNKFKGLVLESTGIGHMPINTKENSANLKALKAVIDSGCVVCVSSQCIFGRVHENIYTNSRRLYELGTVFLEDMTTEAAYEKLSWLLGNYPKKAKELMKKNLRGEISERRLSGEFNPKK